MKEEKTEQTKENKIEEPMVKAPAGRGGGGLQARPKGSGSPRTEKKLKKRRKSDQIVRIGELEELIARYGDEVDPEEIVSMYLPHRKRRRIGAALLRMDRLHMLLMGLLGLVAVLFIVAFMQEKMGSCTINLKVPGAVPEGNQHFRHRRFQKCHCAADGEHRSGCHEYFHR